MKFNFYCLARNCGEFDLQEKNLVPRKIIIRGGTEAKKQQVEKELALSR